MAILQPAWRYFDQFLVDVLVQLPDLLLL